MKRLIFLLICAMTVPAYSLTINPRPGDRIGVLRMADRFADRAEGTVAGSVQRHLRGELRALGFKAFDTRATYDEMLRTGPGDDADYYVEVVSGDASGQPLAEAGTAVGNVAVEVGVVVAHVAAQVRLYDRSLNMVESYDLRKDSTAVLPTGIGVMGHSLWTAITLPFVEYGQYRIAAHQVAHQAALRIAGQ